MCQDFGFSKYLLLIEWRKIDIMYMVKIGNNYNSYGFSILQKIMQLFKKYDLGGQFYG